MDGNGRTARFIMNVMLVTTGYSWRVITVEERSAYLSSLRWSLFTFLNTFYYYFRLTLILYGL